MGIIDIFSKRDRTPVDRDMLRYDALPTPLRVQIVHIWASALGPANDFDYYGVHQSLSHSTWGQIADAIAREHGVFALGPGDNGYEIAARYITTDSNPAEKCLDLVQLSFQVIDIAIRQAWQDFYSGSIDRARITQRPDDAIEELNHRFLENGIGYQFEHGRIIRIDSTFVHAEVVKPTLTLLADPRFKNAQAEFLRAHQAYRSGRYSESLNESLKALESTMKIICDQRRWTYHPTDTASKLLTVVFDNGLIPTPLQTQFNSLKSLLESGTPTARNKLSGHGQGSTEIVVPDYLASYGINTCAANITLLVSAFNGTK